MWAVWEMAYDRIALALLLLGHLWSSIVFFYEMTSPLAKNINDWLVAVGERVFDTLN